MEGEIITIETAQKLAEYDKLKKLVKNQKDVIDKAIEYIKERFYFNEETGEDALLHTFDRCNVKELLDILKVMR